jgi:glutamate-1-semialdehyde 2,1-aminomutase
MAAVTDAQGLAATVSGGEALRQALDAARERYETRNPRSRAAWQAACGAMPGGNTRTVLFHDPYPLQIVRGDGCRIEDADGHRYLNLLGEYTAGLYGHSDPRIRRAIDEALDGGWNLSGHNRFEAELAALICARFPSIERVRFTNSGTEANLMAIGTARVLTGRDRVMVFDGGYHGGLLYFGKGGSPLNAPYDYLVGRYNDADGARATIAAHAAELACVVVEPVMGSGGAIPAEPGFLQALRDATTQAGALLVLDEVMTSRLAPGGAQQLHGVRPDLTTLGKYLGGGMSFGAFGGAEPVMRRFDPRAPDALPHAGTFNNNVLSMAAGAVGLREIFTPQACESLNARGDALRRSLGELFRRHGVAAQATGAGSMIGVHFTDAPIRCYADTAASDPLRKELLFFALLEQGIYMARRGFIALMLPVSDADCEQALAAFERVLVANAAAFAPAQNRPEASFRR